MSNDPVDLPANTSSGEIVADTTASVEQPPRSLRRLEVLSVLETASVVVLFANLATVHLQLIASLIGPIHGTLYLATIAVAALSPIRRTAKLLAVVPIVGGLLAVVIGRRSPLTPERQPGNRLAQNLARAADTPALPHSALPQSAFPARPQLLRRPRQQQPPPQRRSPRQRPR